MTKEGITMIFLPEVNVITVSGVSYTVSIRLVFTKVLVPFSFVISIISTTMPFFSLSEKGS